MTLTQNQFTYYFVIKFFLKNVRDIMNVKHELKWFKNVVGYYLFSAKFSAKIAIGRWLITLSQSSFLISDLVSMVGHWKNITYK